MIRGFRVNLPPGDDRKSTDSIACLGRWNIYAPGYHRIWSWYTLGVCHLRDMPCLTPAKRHFPEATHEFQVFANDPDKNHLVAGGAFWPLEPPNVVIQHAFRDDAAALGKANELFEMCLELRLLLEPASVEGAREAWEDAVRR